VVFLLATTTSGLVLAPIECSGHGFLGAFALTEGPDPEVESLPPSSERLRG
jgi:hypothetical protein